ncbi:MAG TPA: efflux transporter outer membrane subunit [Spongiibacteraceae bacterium]|jgi:multidrug efflux system outer membrane protein
MCEFDATIKRLGFTFANSRSVGLFVLLLCVFIFLPACGLPPRHPPVSTAARAELPLSEGLLQQGQWPADQWWKNLNDDQLDELIERALAGAPNLQQAQARVNAAIRAIDVARAEQGLHIDARAQASRARISKNIGLLNGGSGAAEMPDITSLGLIGLQFQYDFDWWGKRRDAVNAAIDRARASAADRIAAALLLENGVADSYCGWLFDRQRLQITDQLIALNERTLRIAQYRRAQGIDSSDSEQQARAELANARSQRAALGASAQLRLVQLAALLGVAPDQLPPLQSRSPPEFQTALPDAARIGLLGRRPDIIASRWRIEAAAQDVDAARTAYLPNVSLSALVFFVSDNFQKLFTDDSLLWSVGPAVTLPIFDAGRIRAQYGSSRAQLESAIADYNEVVVEAAREVATQTLTLQQLQTQRDQQQIAVNAAAALRITTNARAQQGLIDRRTQNTADMQWLRSQDAIVQINAQKLSTQLALIKALGGGYSESTTRDDSHAGR